MSHSLIGRTAHQRLFIGQPGQIERIQNTARFGNDFRSDPVSGHEGD
jgi:hypothetical protein